MRKTRKKKRGPWIDLSLIGGILGIIAIILVVILTNDEAELLTTKATSVDEIDFKKSEAESAFSGIHIISESSEVAEVPFTIQYPQTKDEPFNLFIQEYVTSAKESYINVVGSTKETPKNKEKGAVNNLTIYFDTFQYDEIYYSFVFTERTQHTKGQMDTSIYTVFYNSKTGKVLDIRTLLGDDKESLETFAHHVRSLLKSDETLKGVLIDEEVALATEPRWILFNQFSIFKDELTIYFDEGTVAPKSNGPVTITVSMSFLNPLLASEFQMDMIEVEAPAASIDMNRKLVALTFDDGPHPQITPQILSALEKYNAKATFYMLGNRVQQYPEVAQNVLAQGHAIGNHTWNHPVLTKLSMEQVMAEYNQTEQAIIDVIGQESTSFRPPYGATNDAINEMIPRDVVIWSIDTLDWKHRNAQTLLTNVQNQIHNHAIILMHDIHQSTADGVSLVLEYLSNEGYEFVTVDEILKYKR